MKELFRICRERTKVKYKMEVSFIQPSKCPSNILPMQVSMVEVYNESVYDLLAVPEDGHQKLTIQKQGKDVVIPVSWDGVGVGGRWG